MVDHRPPACRETRGSRQNPTGFGKLAAVFSVLCFVATAALAQLDGGTAALIEKEMLWKACLEAKVQQYVGLDEPAVETARIAALACRRERGALAAELYEQAGKTLQAFRDANFLVQEEEDRLIEAVTAFIAELRSE